MIIGMCNCTSFLLPRCGPFFAHNNANSLAIYAREGGDSHAENSNVRCRNKKFMHGVLGFDGALGKFETREREIRGQKNIRKHFSGRKRASIQGLNELRSFGFAKAVCFLRVEFLIVMRSVGVQSFFFDSSFIVFSFLLVVFLACKGDSNCSLSNSDLKKTNLEITMTV